MAAGGRNLRQKETVLFKEGVAHVASMLWLQGGDAIKSVVERLETAVKGSDRPPEFRRGVLAACALVRDNLPTSGQAIKIE